MKINNLTKDEVLRHLLTSESGLTEEESKKRFMEFGPNEIREVRKTSLSIRFLGQFTHFLAVLLWIGAGLAFLSEYLHPGEGVLTLGLAIVGVIFINAVFTFIQEYKAEKSIEKLRLLLPFQVKVIREGRERELPAREIVPGDLIILSEGDKVPADARLIDTTYLMVNNAPLTGESEAVFLNHEPSEEELIASRNIAFAGTTVVSGSGKAIVFVTGMRTEFGRIAHLTSAVEAGLSPLQKEIIKVTRIIAFLATITGVVFFVIGHLIGRGFWENFIFAVGIIVANVPEGLLPTVTLSLAMGSQRMARKMALIKTLTSVETLGSVTVICTDKTGTLTQNRMEVKKIWTVDEQQSTVNSLMRIAYFCNNARIIDGEYKGDPTEIALLKAAREAVGDLKTERIAEIPFDSERKRMTTAYKKSEVWSQKSEGKSEFLSLTKGALESVLPLCSYMLTN
ncbi:MAG: HAD-IC family P-type ATPase, partial [Thermodesulfobacteriota bacterium]|nr:HAD-IC family P-type ATPase [Thermodesulfobacteriota bacterium]